ncbi:MAG: NAD(P)-binding domain-containing protein [Chloroflexota bacterium]
MKFSVLGTGMVGQALANKLMALGHEVMMGARSADNANAAEWRNQYEENAHVGTFAQAADFGEIVIIAAKGEFVLQVAEAAGADNTAGKVVIDVTNPLDFSNGMPPSLIPSLSNTTSAAEEVQKILTQARVVKTLNTMNCDIMVDPGRVSGQHDVFISGDSAEAKAAVRSLLQSFGWDDPIDLGPLSTARGTEGMMPFWLSMWGVVGHADFNYRIIRQEK